jgi:hypothetical protein
MKIRTSTPTKEQLDNANVKRYELICRESYGHYKGSYPKSKISEEEWKRVACTFFDTVREHMIRNKSGVILDRLGYFFVMILPIKRYRRSLLKYLGAMPVKQCYTANFSAFKQYLEGWEMENNFIRIVTSQLHNSLKKGIKYRMEYTAANDYFKPTHGI